MASQVRATFFFRALEYGWSETHWLTGEITLPDAMLLANSLATARAPLLGQEASLEYIRVSSDLIQKDALVAKVGLSNGTPTGESGTTVPYAALLLRYSCGSSGLYKRNQFLSGFPAQANLGTLTFPKLVTGVDTALMNYRKALGIGSLNKGPNSWGYRAQVKDPGFFQSFAITGVVVAANKITVTAPGANYKAGDRVKLTRVKTTPPTPLNRTWIVSAPTGLGFFTIATTLAVGAIAPAGGFVQLVGKDVIPYTNMELVKISSRPRGRGYRAPVGRHKRRARVGS